MTDQLELIGKKILLRTPSSEDRHVFDEILNDKESMRALIPFFRGGNSKEWNEEDLSSSYNRLTKGSGGNAEMNLAIITLGDSKVVGVCGFKNIDPKEKTAEFGIILDRDAWGKGISKETHLLALGWAFSELKLKDIYFYTDEHNLRMIGFFEKFGIRFKGTKERMQYFVLTNSEWPYVKTKLS